MRVDSHAEYLRLALTNIARCHARVRAQQSNYWGDAHWGAAVLAACFFAEDNRLDPACDRELHRQLALLVERRRADFEPPFDYGTLTEYDAPIRKALEQTVDRLCWVGHNVIYTALSLKALTRTPEVATPDLISGIVDLLEAFTRSIPGRSWIGWTVGEVQSAKVDERAFPPITNPADLSTLVLNELSAFSTILYAESHHDLIGHLLDFSQAVNLLHDLGHEDLFQRAVVPVKRLISVLRNSQNLGSDSTYPISSPVDHAPLRETVAVEVSPLVGAYWQRDFNSYNWDFGHTFKFPYAYFDHARRVSKAVRDQSLLNFMKILGGSNRLFTLATEESA